MAVTITYRHSTFTFDVDGMKLEIDPFFAPNNSAAPVKADEIEADYVLVSHGHFDQRSRRRAGSPKTHRRHRDQQCGDACRAGRRSKA